MFHPVFSIQIILKITYHNIDKDRYCKIQDLYFFHDILRFNVSSPVFNLLLILNIQILKQLLGYQYFGLFG